MISSIRRQRDANHCGKILRARGCTYGHVDRRQEDASSRQQHLPPEEPGISYLLTAQPTAPAVGREPWHYVVADITFSTLHLLKSAHHLQQHNTTPAAWLFPRHLKHRTQDETTGRNRRSHIAHACPGCKRTNLNTGHTIANSDTAHYCCCRAARLWRVQQRLRRCLDPPPCLGRNPIS